MCVVGEGLQFLAGLPLTVLDVRGCEGIENADLERLDMTGVDVSGPGWE